MNPGRRFFLGIVSVMVLVPSVRAGSLSAGRVLPETRDASVRFSVGAVSEIEGLVEETTRAYYDVAGRPEDQADRESYDFSDFGMDDTYPSIGLSTETIWKYITLQVDLLIMNPDVETTAKRNYYIGVGEGITFEGKTYDNLLIPEGQEFSMDLLAAVGEVRGLVTPFTWQAAEAVRFTPWVDVGLFLFGGYYEIDAGEPVAATTYLNPPEEFVVGGKSDGFVGLALPELGIGGELRVGVPEAANLLVRARYGVCRYEGGSGAVTTSDHREKDLDIDHRNVRVRLLFEQPLESGRQFTLGLQYQNVDSDGTISSTAETEEEILEERERFDKRAEFSMNSFMALAGLTF